MRKNNAAAIFIAAVMLLVLAVPAAAADAYVVIEEDFSRFDAEAPGPGFRYEPGAVQVVEENGNRFLLVQGNFNVLFDQPLTGIVTVEMDIMEKEVAHLADFSVRNQSNNPVTRVRYNNIQESFQFMNPDTEQQAWKGINPKIAQHDGQWHRLKIVLNTNTELIDFYIDGEEALLGHPYRTANTAIEKILHFPGSDSAGTYLDNIRVTATFNGEPPAAPDPAGPSEPAAPGTEEEPAQPEYAPQPEPGWSITILLDGLPLAGDAAPVLVESRVLAPFETLFEALGLQAEWDEAANTLKGSGDQLTIELQVGRQTAHVNGQLLELDVPALLIDGRLLAPVRFIAEAARALVDWELETQTVLIAAGKDEAADPPNEGQ